MLCRTAAQGSLLRLQTPGMASGGAVMNGLAADATGGLGSTKGDAVQAVAADGVSYQTYSKSSTFV